ncbi:DUF3331 domain-containing protein [Paraburkholderia ferrariae]|uniref:DUF3331 domain-containing protein n=1 Tax=Paraburkholderia ferrariae TaxID=386056 RepID=UPI001470437C
MREPSAVDAWQYTLDLLSGASVPRSPRKDTSRDACAARGKAAARTTPTGHARLAIVEAWSDNLVSVSWSDSTSGRYSEQPWRLCIARRGGVCALTGAHIRRGDRVFRPLSRKLKSVNDGWAVLASALKTA